ncbi:hypothetical protein BU26DRAFT_546937 [Trematosphaeria pertusa]|uniref:Uncharacterized protein n=1 Tax=Trematosphaeria pertusa TaxID=390896 RepID=A0A6A6IXQ7_9PLEO|nr:uncharacterized protein BU26DRAFT_546937 [Trematosphaeria pertusa]KAF2254807.1 hypothetical protein BU26DRAFT_546937 [Trematosphaeria pertusa]
MCHWVLRIWKCGDSFFTKYSSCSFDRAVHDPNNLLNPLHPSITPCGVVDKATPQPGANINRYTAGSKKKTGYKSARKGRHNGKLRTNGNNSATWQPTLSLVVLPAAESFTPRNTPGTVAANGAKTEYPRDAKTGEVIPVPLSEIGKASRFGDKSLGDSESKCNVFEVVLQSKEPTEGEAAGSCERVLWSELGGEYPGFRRETTGEAPIAVHVRVDGAGAAEDHMLGLSGKPNSVDVVVRTGRSSTI